MTQQMGEQICCSECGQVFQRWIKWNRRCRDCHRSYDLKRYHNAGGAKKAREYNKTRKGLLVRTYRNMKSRVSGVQWNKRHLYLGLELLDKEDFYEWSLEDTEFNRLFDIWEGSGFERRLTPSIDRLCPNDGYHLLNMRWTTLSENSRRGAISRFYGRNV